MRILTFLLFSLVITGCADSESSESTPGPDQIVRLSDSEIKGLDPQKISDLSSLRVAADQFEGLTRHNAQGEIEAGLAKSWTVTPDGLKWTFLLRQGLKFSDSVPISAQLFEGIFDRLKDPKTASPTQALFENILAVQARDNEVIVSLKNPAPQLPELLTHPALSAIPLHRIARVGDAWTNDRPMVTSGAYQLDRWLLNDHAKLTYNANWHENRKPIKTIIWKPMDDSLSGMRLFLSGGADITADYPPSRHHWLKENYPLNVHNVPYLGSYYFAFNTRYPPFDDARVRRALSMAVEREWIAEKVIGVGNPPAWGLLPPGLASDDSYLPNWASWPRDQRLEVARSLLSDAGYDSNNPLRFEIRFNSSAEHRRVSVALAAMWKSLNVEASLFNSEAALHFAALRQHNFTLARSGWIADLPTQENFLLVHQQANGSGNYSGYDNSKYNVTLASAIAEPDPQKRSHLMRDAEKILIDDMPILPLYFYVTRSLVSERVSGWENNISNVHPSRTLRIRVK
ncbi:MAG: peptide ABC transporter substrate-binding protein [Parasphingorhabdus sp.]